MAATSKTGTASITSQPTTLGQRVWDDQCYKMQAEQLLDDATDHVARARLLAASSTGSGDWLDALPLTSAGLKMDNATVRIAAGLRFGARRSDRPTTRVRLRCDGD